MLKRVRWRFVGRVQGVGFRAHCAAHARAAGVDGWVRNEPDGTVSMEAAGAADALDVLREVLRSGLAWARVDRIDETILGADGASYGGFDITG